MENTFDRKDFRNWIELKQKNPDGSTTILNRLDKLWKEVLYQINTQKGFTHKQDLVALFNTEYNQIKSKLNDYTEEFNELPLNVLNGLIFEFRESFPKHGRIEGINYFDDLIEMTIEKYNQNNKKVVDNEDGYVNAMVSGMMFFERERAKINRIENRSENINTINQINMDHPPQQSQNKIDRKEKIKWNKNTSLLAYLFYKLEVEKIITGGTIPANLAQIFTDKKYQVIEPKSIQKAITDYKNNVKAQSSDQIDEIVQLIKDIAEKLD